MPNHVHLLIEPRLPAFPMAVVLNRLKGRFANHVLRRWRGLNASILPRLTDRHGKTRFWQPGGGYDRNIVSSAELEQKINYIHNNPVAGGLARTATDWQWSSARWYAGVRDDSAPVIDQVVIL